MKTINEATHTDFYLTGKLYPKIDLFIERTDGEMLYVFSTSQFKTQKRLKEWIRAYDSIDTDAKIITKKS